jgi:peptidoglycan/LPS O-acetylase OafA/YrhL
MTYARRRTAHSRADEGFIGLMICGMLCALLAVILAAECWFLFQIYSATSLYQATSDRTFVLDGVLLVALGTLFLLESPWRSRGRFAGLLLFLGSCVIAATIASGGPLPAYAVVGSAICAAMAVVMYELIKDVLPRKSKKHRQRRIMAEQEQKTGSFG